MKTRAQKEREARHWQARKGRSQRRFEAGSLTPEKEELPKKLTRTEFLEEKVYKSYKPGKVQVVRVCKHKEDLSSEKSKHVPAVEQNTQLKPTALEVINYKTGTQGYPENVEEFEKMVAEQDPHRHVDTDILSKEQWRRETEAGIPYTDFRSEKAVFNALNEMRTRWGLKPADFSEVTKKWFREHPADAIYLNSHNASYSEARKWAGFKTGLKGKGRKVTRAKMSPEERKKAKAEAQRRRAKEARNKK